MYRSIFPVADSLFKLIGIKVNTERLLLLPQPKLMRILLLSCLMTAYLFSFGQNFILRDLSIGYRIGEGEAVGGNPLTIPVNLKRPAAFQAFLDQLNWNSLYGNPGPVTNHRIFAQAEIKKADNIGIFWSNTTIPIGVNFSFRETRGDMGIGNNYWYTQPADSTFDSKTYWIEQRINFAGLHAGLNHKIRIGKRLEFLTGILLAGEMAVLHKYRQWADTSSFSPTQHRYVHVGTDRLPDLKGRNFIQWSILVPLAAEINVYKKQWLVKPEITIGWLANKYLIGNKYSLESINAALWFIYRRK